MKKIILTITLILSTSAFSSTAFIEKDKTGSFIRVCTTLNVGHDGTGAPVGQDGTGAPVGQDGTGAPVGQDGTGAPVGQDGTGAPVSQNNINTNLFCEIINIKS